MSEFEITEENYKGYCELANVIFNGVGMNTEDAKKLIIPELSLMFPGIFCANVNLEVIGAIMLFAGLSLPILSSFKNYKHDLNQVKLKYPYVNTHISYMELENALKKARIISRDNGKTILDVTGYQKRLEEQKKIEKYEEIKLQYLNETRFYNVNSDLYVEEIPKVKKIGTR